MNRSSTFATASLTLVLFAGCSDQAVSTQPAQILPAVSVPATEEPEATVTTKKKGPFHLDDEKQIGPPLETTPVTPREPGSKQVELVLRSSPPGANAAVDGVIIGRTPTLWRARRDGKVHEFTFVLTGHSVARYKFIPIRSGVVHGSLQRLRLNARKAEKSE